MPTSPRKPPLSIVTPTTTGIQPPRPLGAHGRAFWDRVMAEYRIDDVGGREILQQGCAAIDLSERLAEIVASEGEVVRSRSGAVKSHPALRDLVAARALVLKCIQRLGIDLEPIKSPGRPSQPQGWVPPELR